MPAPANLDDQPRSTPARATTHAPCEAPFLDLTPDAVLDALDAVGLRGDGRLLQLNSYENRVVQADLVDGRTLVAKFYRPGRWTDAQILEEHAFARELADDEIPVGAPLTLQATSDATRCLGEPPTLAHVGAAGDRHRLSVTSKVPGRSPEVDDLDTLTWIGRSIGRLHAVGRRRPFVARRTLGVATVGATARDWLMAHGTVPPDVAPDWTATVDTLLQRCHAAFDTCGAYSALRLHGDCHLGNLLWSADGPTFVDLDDAVNGPAVQDLWMLLAGHRGTRQQQLGAVLDGYESFLPFDRRELGMIEALRTLRMLHHSAWIAQRWQDPAFPAAFPWFGAGSYWAQQLVVLREQLDAMDEAPLIA